MDVKPVRILHVVASMNRAGLETWLMNVMRRIDRTRFLFDFCVHTDLPGDYDDEIVSLGGRVLPCVWRGNVFRFQRLFRKILRENHFDVVHAHAYNFAGVVLRAAAKENVAHRIAHLHTIGDGRRTTPLRVMFRKSMVHLVRRHATKVLGCTRSALDHFIGANWTTDARMEALFCGVPVEAFEPEVDPGEIRAALGVPLSAKIWLHVGRFIEAKNHRKLVEIFQGARHGRSDDHLVLVGEGPLIAATREQVESAGLTSCVHFLGVRSDVPALMKAADVMVMPSIREGLPVTLIEATAAGLPVVITDMPGTREAVRSGCRATLVSLDESASHWSRSALDALDAPRLDPQAALTEFRGTPFTSEASARAMEQIYEGCGSAASRYQ